MAKMSSAFEILDENIWVNINTDMTKIANSSNEKYKVVDVMIKNQKESPAVTAMDLNLGEESSMLNRVDEW